MDTPFFPVYGNFLTDNSGESSVSDCESSVSNPSSSPHRRVFQGEAAVEVEEGVRVYEVIRRRFISCLGEEIGSRVEIEAIHRRNWLGCLAQAKLQAFQILTRALANKNGGVSNVKFAWYGDSKERIENIFSLGFSHLDVQSNINGALFLSPDHSPLSSVEGTIADDDGLRHVLLCRVILGESEPIQLGSNQTHPSSGHFDSGVDDVHNPNKYIIWSTNMNSHILPEYIVSFRVSDPTHSSPPPMRGCLRMENITNTKMPTSPWVSFPALISVLAKFLPQNAVSLINKYHKEYKERRITRPELIQKVRKIAGDKLLGMVIKSCKGSKDLKTSIGFLRNIIAKKEWEE